MKKILFTSLCTIVMGGLVFCNVKFTNGTGNSTQLKSFSMKNRVYAEGESMFNAQSQLINANCPNGRTCSMVACSAGSALCTPDKDCCGN